MSTSDARVNAGRLVTAWKALERRVANPLLRRVLRSRLHWPASRWLLLVSYDGRRSGVRYSIPVLSTRLDGAFVAVTPTEETRWWTNFRDGRRCTLWTRGRPRPGVGTVVRGDERERLLEAHFDAQPLLRWLFGAPADARVDAFTVLRFEQLDER
ncbi:hypothetical protein [Natronobiforma cellulositropha]|uniref:hypothetical protein n=1 Tax=Natronobiforma cellulositropha TaxID=1679076 RepID=UPI0021D60EC8|nr:hypothetical protein [Natronobiforma cellulositropha]